MTAVTSHQCLPDLIDAMPKGEAKDMVLRLCGHSIRYAPLQVSYHNALTLSTHNTIVNHLFVDVTSVGVWVLSGG